MKNRILVLLFVIASIGSFNTQKVSAQISSGTTPNFIELTSYNGSESINRFNFILQVNGNNINYPKWSLAVRLGESMTNAEGKTIDPSKVSVRFNKFQITQGVPKTIAGMNADRSAISLSLDDRFIIRNSNEPLYHGNDDYYSMYLFYFDILIEGGSYLEDLLSNPPVYDNNFQYPFHLIFSVLDENDNVLTQSSAINKIKINPKDTPPSGPDFGFEVHADVSLNFNVPEDYTRKVESSEESWLKVSSKTSKYVVKVHTSDLYFEGQNDIPVDVVSMQVEDKKDSRTGSEVSLKNSDQTVFTGNATGSEPRKLDVRYFITENEAKGLATYRPGAYTTRLTYTLLPQ